MEILASAIVALGKAISAWATAYGFIYVAGIASKTLLIYMEKAKVEELKDWFNFGFGRKKGGL